MNVKSNYTIWGRLMINGESKYGVNERRQCGLYTVGPHDGFAKKSDAQKLLTVKRQEENQHLSEIRFCERNKKQGQK